MLSGLFWIEVHPVNPGDKRERNKDRRDDRQNPHDLVGPDVDAGEVEVHEIAGGIAERFQNMTMNNACCRRQSRKNGLVRSAIRPLSIPHQLAENIPLRPNSSTNSGDESPEFMEFVHSFPSWLIKERLLKIIHRFA